MQQEGRAAPKNGTALSGSKGPVMRAQRPFDPQLLWRTGQEEGKLGWPRPLSEIPRVRSLIWDWPDKGAPTNIVTPYIWALPVWRGGSKRFPRWFGALI